MGLERRLTQAYLWRMIIWLRKTFLAIGVLALLSVPFKPSLAHPHAWLDLQSTLVFGDDGKATALQMEWLFGDFYSSYVLEDITATGEDLVEGLRETARGNLIELEAYDYFVDFQVDGERVDLARVEQFETGVLDGRVYLRFTVSLTQPVDPVARSIRYAVYDPTYYIEVLYAEGAEAKTVGRNCDATIVAANPTFEEAAFAASLGQEESGGNGLGVVFAEWVELTCP